ncbi:hypothetical protein Tco_0883822 [Tanacetum coccineum]
MGGRWNETILHMLCIADSLLNVLVEGLEIVNHLLDIFPFYGRVGSSIDMSGDMGSLVVVEHHSMKKKGMRVIGGVWWSGEDKGSWSPKVIKSSTGRHRWRNCECKGNCQLGHRFVVRGLLGSEIQCSWNLKNGKTLTVVPAGRCLWPNSTGLLQRAPASADDELYWPSFGESSHDQQDRIHRAMDKGDWFGHA